MVSLKDFFSSIGNCLPAAVFVTLFATLLEQREGEAALTDFKMIV
jgi:hypothetical protein